jgi:ABC-type multidrug transport system fused ATPase/permease subunit
MNADHIYVLREGRVVEEGTYQSLMSGHGAFSSMARLQTLESRR